ncbi:MAG: PP2C family protein-serine/threonine phosphatase [Bryobacterales bacterium]|nr:PP2C family protein-serine/threonine phosphatase [Bryobacterales bacterium]
MLALLSCLAAEFLLSGSPILPLLRLAAYVFGAWAALRLARRLIRKAIWRLRNRLMVAYAFIAVVPVALILVLAGLGIWMATTQVAVYLVTSELDQRTASLKASAQWIASMPGASRDASIRQILPEHVRRFPGLEILVVDSAEHRYPEQAAIDSPEGWGEAGGAVVKAGRLYAWARVVRGQVEVTLMTPLTVDVLSEMVPNLGEVNYRDMIETAPGERKDGYIPRLVAGKKRAAPAEPRREPRKDYLPAPANRIDVEVAWISALPVSIWESAGKSQTGVLAVRSRPSAVFNAVSARKADWEKSALPSAFVVLAVLILIVEMVSLIAGISLTRTITAAVHGLHEATLRVKEADFSHRIQVQGNDQLADLSHSFNSMTENLELLLAVAKEKERLQSELEIAREVQSQLYPKSAPTLKGLTLQACCNPARMVSGDYYDYQAIGEHRLALAIGDVAGKGISAALLMATVESCVRTQIRHCLQEAAGNGRPLLSTSKLVAQLNQQLYAHTSPEKYATFYLGVFDDESGLLAYTNAGHLPPILVRRGTPQLLEVNGMVVGAFPFSQWSESQLHLESGDLLVCYTDGVTEPENEFGEMFGEQRLMELLVKHSDADTQEIVARVSESVRQWTGSSDLQDDMTLLVARRN